MTEEALENWPGYVKSNPMLSNAVKVLKKITDRGYAAYLVGGCVRDIILGDDPHDVDICGNAPLNVIETLFDTYGLNAEKFGIIGIKLGGHTYEYALMRSESYEKIVGVRKIIKK